MSPCVLCGATAPQPLQRRGLRHLQRCDSCGLVSVRHIPGPSELREVYSEEYFRNAHSHVSGYEDYAKVFRQGRELKENESILSEDCNLIGTPEELIAKIANANPHLYQRDIERIVNTVLDEIINALKEGDRVELGTAGAYTSACASVGFNGFPPPEVVVLPPR